VTLSRDAIAGAFVAALALGYWLVADDIPRSLLADAVGAEGVPKVLGILLGALGLALIWRGIRRVGERGADRARWRVHARAMGLLAVGLGYIVVIPWLGFAVTTALLIVVAAVYAGRPLGRDLVLIGAVSGAVFWFVFAKLLSVSVPPGSWTGLWMGS